MFVLPDPDPDPDPAYLTVLPKSTLNGYPHTATEKVQLMNTQECASLVERIIQTWPTGPRGRIWTELLTDLEPGTAGTAYIRLRNEHQGEKPPSTGTFMRTYRSLRTPANDPITDDCPDCSGTGWISSPPIEPGGTGYQTVHPCGCRAGNQAERISQKIDEHRRHHRQGPYAPQFQRDADHGTLTDLDLFHQDNA